MKGKALFLALMVLAITFTGCGSGTERDPNEPTGSPEVTGTDKPDDQKNGTEIQDLSGNPIKIVFFELGKADAFLIYNEGTAILIDTGEPESAEDILSYMEKKGVDSLDYLFISHFDKDHVGGASRIINAVDVKQVYTSNYPKSSGEYDNFKSAVNKKKIAASVLRENSEFEINGIKIEVNTPVLDIYEEDPSNNSSLIIRVSYGEKSFLFMGDAKAERLREYILSNPEKCNVIKMPYHGAYLPGLDDLLKNLQPQYAVITSSKENKEAEETNQTLKDHKVQIYKTRKGRIIMETDGRDLSITQK